ADLPDEVSAVLHQSIGRLEAVLAGDTLSGEERDRFATLRASRATLGAVQAAALAAARAEILAARREPGVDPEAADRVLHRLDLRTVLLD
ncbi:MAG: Na+/H+ antiporter, partial [Pseudonocardia sp.]